MGRGPRQKPLRLGEKLRRIREALDLSQNGMLIRLKLDGTSVGRNSISAYELGQREPPLLVLYEYAKAANVHMEVLVDDELDLPKIIPAEEKKIARKRKNS